MANESVTIHHIDKLSETTKCIVRKERRVRECERETEQCVYVRCGANIPHFIFRYYSERNLTESPLFWFVSFLHASMIRIYLTHNCHLFLQSCSKNIAASRHKSVQIKVFSSCIENEIHLHAN